MAVASVAHTRLVDASLLARRLLHIRRMPREAAVGLRCACGLRVAPLADLVGPLVAPMRRAIGGALRALLLLAISHELQSVDVAALENVVHQLEQVQHEIVRLRAQLLTGRAG